MSITTLSYTIIGSRIFLAPTLFCAKGHRIERFCSKHTCKNDSFCCIEQSCNICESKHQLCTFKRLKQLNNIVQERLFLHNKVMRRLFLIQNELINQLMANRKQIIDKSKSEEWEFGIHSEIIDSIYRRNDIKGLKGKDMKKLFFGLSEKNEIQFKAEQFLDSYKTKGKQMIQKLQELREKIIQNLGKGKNGANMHQKQSAPIKSQFEPNKYYRFTTLWQGPNKSLDVKNDGINNQLQLADTGNYSGQNWKITWVNNDYYRLTTMWQGDGKSLDIVNDGVNNKIQLAQTGNYSGQRWRISKINGGFYRLTTQWLGPEKSLDVVNDGVNNKIQMDNTGNYSGQHWKIQQII